MRYLRCEVECLRTERKLAIQEKLLIYRDKSMVGTMFIFQDPSTERTKGVHERTVQLQSVILFVMQEARIPKSDPSKNLFERSSQYRFIIN